MRVLPAIRALAFSVLGLGQENDGSCVRKNLTFSITKKRRPGNKPGRCEGKQIVPVSLTDTRNWTTIVYWSDYQGERITASSTFWIVLIRASVLYFQGVRTMFPTRTVTQTCVAALAAAAIFLTPERAFALLVIGNGGQNQAMAGPQIQRAQNPLPNPTNFWQYSQITGVKPTIGTVRIYNQFGTFGNQNGNQNQDQGGLGGIGGLVGALGGGLGGAGGNQLPGVGATNGGDDPPQGVLLHVNYANMFFPNQTQLNGNNQQQGFGGLGALGGLGGLGLGGLGKAGRLGNGGDGL
jgi:hypothetical protein